MEHLHSQTSSTMERLQPMKPRLLSLPIELLEHVCFFMVPPRIDRYYTPLRSLSYGHLPTKRFRQDCGSMRLACRAFSMLQTLLAALFYDFNVFVSPRSIANLESLSQHPVLRNYVRRLVFCRPVFPASLDRKPEYERKLMGPPSRIPTPGRKYTGNEVAAGFRAYKTAYQDQERLLGDELLVEKCGLWISQFPNLWSVFISGSVPEALNLDRRPDVNGRALLQKQNPDVLFRAIPDDLQSEYDGTRSANRHTAFVLRALAAANAHLDEFVTYDNWGPTWEFSWNSVPAGLLNSIDFSELSRLDLCLRDGRRAPGGADWSAVLCPLLAKLPFLVELYLRFNARRNPHPTAAEIWKMNFPELALLSIEGLKLTRTTFCDFLRRHEKLAELTLENVRESAGRWKTIFTTIREHPSLEDLALQYLGDFKLESPIITFNELELPDELTLELSDYLHGEGEWTANLSELWGDL